MTAGQRCGRRTRAGGTCQAWPIAGASCCRRHGGASPQVRRKAAVRAELARWGLDSPEVDPGETLLKLVSQSAARVGRYGDEIAAMVAEHPTLRLALTGAVWRQDGDGEDAARIYQAGEYIRAMVRLENEERDRCARFSKLAVDAGLREREIQVAERQGQMIASVLRAVLGSARVGLTPEQLKAAIEAIDEHVGAQLALDQPRKDN